MLDKNSNEILNCFTSLNEAAQFLINNELTNCKRSTIKTHISEVCKEKRKSVASYK